MSELYNKINIYLINTVFLFSFFFASCKTDDSVEIVNGHFSSLVDTSIFLDTFPSNVYLELGKSVLIENGMTIFRFIAVLENNETNSLIRLQIQYENGIIKTIDLNTKNIPQTYSLENDYNHQIHLKELNSMGSTYQIMFTYNKYGRL